MLSLRSSCVPLLAAVLLTAGCSKKIDEPASVSPGSSAAPRAAASAKTSKSDISWSDPPGWQRRPGSNPMRRYEYKVARTPGDSEDAELVVTTFGPGQGGSVDENIERWVRQFTPDDKSSADRTERTVAGMKVTLIDVDGTFRGMGQPNSPAPPPRKPRFRVLGAVVESPGGMWFFKITGPDETVKSARGPFHTMIDSIKPPAAP